MIFVTSDVGGKFPAELYNVDGATYESVNLFFLAIFRGFGGGGDRVTAELNELHLGYSRDGFETYATSSDCDASKYVETAN